MTDLRTVLLLCVSLVLLAACGSSGGGGVVVVPTVLSHDIDGDGNRDLLVGAYNGGASNQGEVHVFFGPTFAAVADLVITGETAGDAFGVDLDASGDMNGDGIADLLVGANNGPLTGNADAGRAYVIFGRRDRGTFPTLAANADVLIDGEALSENFGIEVLLGDVNGDRLMDLIIGDSWYNARQGRLYVFHGAAAFPTGSRTVATADSVITGSDTITGFIGTSSAGDDQPGDFAVGDLNQDGFNDLVVGSTEFTSEGFLHVFFGSATGVGTRNVSAADASIDGEVGMSLNDDFGSGVLVADLNNDGILDIGAGDAESKANDGTLRHGSYFIFFGTSPFWTAKTAADADVRIDHASVAMPTVPNEDVGIEMGAGDVNGDGIVDLIVGDEEGDDPVGDTGMVYVFFGPITASETVATADVKITGTIQHDTVGRSVSVRDYNGDGTDDILIGAEEDAVPMGTGAAYLFLGRNPWPMSLTIAGADSTLSGPTLNGRFGFSVAE